MEIDDGITKVTRDQLCKILEAENVLARRYFYPGRHRMELYRSYYPHAGLLLPNTERISECVLPLPNGTAITPQDVFNICEIVNFVVKHRLEISQALKA